MKTLEGRVALVTGGSGGIGSACAKVLGEAGAHVVVTGRNRMTLDEVVQTLREDGASAEAITLDVTSGEQFHAVVSEVHARHGRIDVLHNNAAGTDLYDVDRDVADMDIEAWESIVRTSLVSTMIGCREVAPIMAKNGCGSIINMSSTRSELGAHDLAAYGSAKAGVDAFTKYVAVMYGRSGVRCNAVQPGLIVTGQSKRLHDPKAQEHLLDKLCLPYAGTPEDVADLVHFLASDASRFITGQTFRIDGGMLSKQPFL